MTKHVKNLDGITRREMLVGSGVVGVGLAVGYSALPGLTGGAREALAAGSFNHQLFLTMDSAGIATVHITKHEIGQHVGTALAQAVAEELEIDWNDVRIDYPDSDEKWGLMITGGSWSVNWTFDRNSRIGASARIALSEAGARLLGVPVSQVSVSNSVVSAADGASLTYAEIISKAIIDRSFTEEELKAIQLKKFGEYSVVGQSIDALDIPTKINGTAKYGIDVFVPNMVYGRMVTNPTRFGAVPISADDSEAKAIDGYAGVAVIKEDPTGVNTGYVIAFGETYWAAEKAAAAMNVNWDSGPNANTSSADIVATGRKLISDDSAGFTWVLEGDPEGGMSSAKTTVEAEYQTSLGYHGLMEPINAVAMESGGVWHIYTGSQFQTRFVGMTAAALGVDAKNVIHHQTYSGTGFGRRLEPDGPVIAALASQQIGRPVKLIYTREQDLGFDFHQSHTVQKVKGGVNAGGQLDTISHDVCSGWATKRMAPGFMAESVDKKGKIDQFSTNGSDHWYNIPNHYVRSIENTTAMAATPPGQLRAVAPTWTWWAVESFIDEVAHKLGQDPLDLRLSLLDASGKNVGGPPNTVGGAHRLRNALIVAAGKAGYGVKPMPENTAQGIAAVASQERGSPAWTAVVAEVHVDPSSGEPTLNKLTVAMDIGTAVNPGGVEAQIQGSALFGTSRVLYEDVTMKNGAIEQQNFDTWTPMRINQAPEIDVSIIQNGHYPAGCGEPVTTCVGPAIGNAVFNASGARVRTWPITAEKIKAAQRGA